MYLMYCDHETQNYMSEWTCAKSVWIYYNKVLIYIFLKNSFMCIKSF